MKQDVSSEPPGMGLKACPERREGTPLADQKDPNLPVLPSPKEPEVFLHLNTMD
jgi:hypothetical protein